jgi:hypothetical protein
MVRGGCNKAGIIWIHEARFGRGWHRFVAELRPLLASVSRSSLEGPELEDPSGGSQ